MDLNRLISYDTLNDQAIYANLTLQDITLNSMGLYGSLSGILGPGIYFVGGDINVSIGNTLLINPGTILLFNQDVLFSINGTVIASGTSIDSIIFSRKNLNTWKGISISGASSNGSIFRNCLIEYSNLYGMTISQASPNVEQIVLRRNNKGLGVFSTNITFNHLMVYENNNQIVSNASGAGITITGSDGSKKVIIKNSIIKNNINISNPYGTNCNSGGIYLGGIQLNLINSIVSKNQGKSTGGISFDSSPGQIKIINCLIDSNSGFYRAGGIETFAWEDKFSIINTIISNNFTLQGECGGIGLYYNFNNSANVLNCDFWNNVGGNIYNQGSIIGNIVTTNNNGTASDGFYNIFENPSFYFDSINNVYLQNNSPCIEAGLNDSVTVNVDLYNFLRIQDGNNDSIFIVDIGPIEYGDSIFTKQSINHISNEILIYPNPTANVISVTGLNIRHVKILNLLGEDILNMDKNYNNFSFDLLKFDKGVYIISVKTDYEIINKKIIKR